MSKSTDIIVGLDIGTTKVCAIVGQMTENGKINVLGMGKAPSMGGVSRGMVANIGRAEAAIRAAIEEAKRQSQVDIKTVFVGIAGQHIQSRQHNGILSRPQAETEITGEELAKLEKDMENLALGPGIEILHVLPQEYRIDDEDGIKDPIGRMGVRVECNFHIITGQESAAKHIFKAVERAGLHVADLIVEPIASAKSVLSQEEMEAGVCLVDIGGGTTDICIFEGGFIRHTAIIPMGGNRITADLREAFGILEEQAEVLKVDYGSPIPSEEKKNQVVVIQGLPGRKPKEISLYSIAQVINARVLDIVDRINEEIDLSGLRNKLGGGIVITGGGSAMKDLSPLMEYLTALEVHPGLPLQHLAKGMVDEVKNPMFSTGIGLVLQGFHLQNRIHSPENTKLAHEQVSTKKGTHDKKQLVEADEEPKSKNWAGNWGFLKSIKNWMEEGDDFQDKM